MIPKTRTCSAITNPFSVAPNILFNIWVATKAMCFGMANRQSCLILPLTIHFFSYWLKMFRVYTRTVMAKVVNFQTERNSPYKVCVRETTGLKYLSANLKATITIPTLRSRPIPALSCRVKLNLWPKACDRWLIDPFRTLFYPERRAIVAPAGVMHRAIAIPAGFLFTMRNRTEWFCVNLWMHWKTSPFSAMQPDVPASRLLPIVPQEVV